VSFWLDHHLEDLQGLKNFEVTISEEESHIEKLCRQRLEVAEREVEFWKQAYRDAKIARAST